MYIIFCLCLHHFSRSTATNLVTFLEVPEEISLFVISCLLNITRILFLVIPILFYRIFYDKDSEGFYGLTGKSLYLRPYVFLLVFMLPLIIWASFQDSFQKVYPRYKPETAEQYLGVSHWLTFSLFEVSYALRFIGVELFFRGFLILGVQRILGNSCVTMMTCIYVFIHFGKPMPETIGSLFGGFILGTITLKSKNIYGGIFLHMGVALLMELVAIIQWTH
ncbi:MAG: CPBP family intramembrane glutamic endopeptidase [Spirochaetota bacterium]